MVQIIENWSDLTGVVRAIRPTSAPDFLAVRLRVDDAVPVVGFAHLLSKSIGTDIELLVPAKLAADSPLSVGARIRCRVRRADLKRNYIHRKHLVVES